MRLNSNLIVSCSIEDDYRLDEKECVVKKSKGSKYCLSLDCSNNSHENKWNHSSDSKRETERQKVGSENN